VNIRQLNASTGWLYATNFSVSNEESSLSTHTQLLFQGINYRANIWVDGILIASNATIVGAFRYFKLDITTIVNASSSTSHSLLVQVFMQHDRSLPSTNHDTDLGITFVDWAPPPPDSSSGIWRSVIVSSTGPLSVQSPVVHTTLTSTAAADLTVAAQLESLTSQPLRCRVDAVGTLEGQIVFNVTQALDLGPQSSMTVTFDATTYPALHILQPALWWPWQMGNATLHSLTLTVWVNDETGWQVSDTVQQAFGIREITSELDANGYRLYSVNSQRILIRGAGWSPDLLLRFDADDVWAKLLYTRDMNLNALRLEGKMEPDMFFDMCDELGILILVGWCCCDSWQHWKYWEAEQYNVSAESMQSQVMRLRIHPSVMVFMLSSDELPPYNVEEEYTNVAQQQVFPNPIIAAASAAVSNVSGPTGVKMSGPYSWVPPIYWLQDTGSYGLGGAWGFLTEGGPGENPLTLESLQRTVPASDLWPPLPDNCWGHCGDAQGLFGDLTRFNLPLNERYGVAVSLADYLMKAQVQVYEGHRAMFEAYSRQKYKTATGVIQWMLNTAWPESIWHLFDAYMVPGASYFAVKKACSPLHAQYSYDDASVWIVNSYYAPIANITLRASILLLNASQIYSSSVNLSIIPADASIPVLRIPDQSAMQSILSPNSTYLVRLEMSSTTHRKEVNDYWLSTRQDVLLWNQSTFYMTPCSQYANFSGLQSLPVVELIGNVSILSSDSVEVLVFNPSESTLVFFVRASLLQQGTEILPVLWSDNYITLLPLELRVLTAKFLNNLTDTPLLSLTTWNDRLSAPPLSVNGA
jgi:exo-1,4-beta-D-glucosaminidase